MQRPGPSFRGFFKKISKTFLLSVDKLRNL
nr:MAG TPA: hypothetical protein [Caudoviricetes sp.]